MIALWFPIPEGQRKEPGNSNAKNHNQKAGKPDVNCAQFSPEGLFSQGEESQGKE